MRYGIPVFQHPPGNDLSEGTERFFEDRAPLREIELLGSRLLDRRPTGRRDRLSREALQSLNVSSDILQHDAPAAGAAPDFGKVDAEVAREFSKRWRRGRRDIGFWFGGPRRLRLLRARRGLRGLP